jgi:hypothetical protein
MDLPVETKVSTTKDSATQLAEAVPTTSTVARSFQRFSAITSPKFGQFPPKNLDTSEQVQTKMFVLHMKNLSRSILKSYIFRKLWKILFLIHIFASFIV